MRSKILSIRISQKNKKNLSLSTNLRELRQIKKITLEQLANALNIKFYSLRNYEQDDIIPPQKNLVKIAKYFNISIDFLILWKNTIYIRSILLLSLACHIDITNQVQRFQVESTANTLLGKKNREKKILSKMDLLDLKLSNNIHKNIKLLRENKNVTQQELADYIGISQKQISEYEKNQTPTIEKLIKLSDFFYVSIHSIITGDKLLFSLNNKYLQEVILKADRLLSLEDKETLIKLMQRIIEDSE